jgi:hypothetical protein
MRKLRFYLPLAQTALAMFLMFLSWRKQPWTTGSTLECDISYGMNAPVAFISSFLAKIGFVAANRAAWFSVSYLLYFALVALLWYAASLEARGSGGSTIMATFIRRIVIRRIAGAVLVACGLFGASLGVGSVLSTHQSLYKELPIMVGVFLWGLLIAWFYGRDFWITFRTHNTHWERAGAQPKP